MLRKASLAIAVVWLAGLAGNATAMAQETNNLAIDIASVNGNGGLSAVVNVLDGKGRPIAGLYTASFTAKIDGQPATVQGLQAAVDSHVSLAVVLAVDASGSMAGEPLSAAQAAAAEFINGLSPQDSVAVLAFSDAVTVVQDSTTDRVAAANALHSLVAVGNTALFEATSRATAEALRSPSPRRVIILLSDGVDYGYKSTVSRNDSIALARAAGVPVYTIALGADVDRAYLTDLAQATGARILEAPAPAALSELYSDIAAVLRGQYVVTLNAPNIDSATTRTLEISVTTGGATATASRSLAAGLPDQSPNLALTGLNPGQEVKSAVTITAQFSGTPSQLVFLVDGKPLATATAPPYQVSLDPTVLKSGNHILRVEARDTNGSVLASSDVQFSVSGVAANGKSNLPLLAGLLVAVLVLGGAYFVRRRRPHVKRRIVEVRLKPWSANGAAMGGLPLSEEEPPPSPPSEEASEHGGKLIVIGGPDAGCEFFVGTNPLCIGSANWCDITLSDSDGSIGAEEARAWVHQGRLIFHRLTRLSLLATDGTTGGWLILEDGDEVHVGAFSLRFISLMPATEEEKTLNKAVNEAVEHLAGRQTPSAIISGPAASELWPVYDPPHQDPLAEEEVATPADAFDESSEDSPPPRPALWPVDKLPEVALTEEEDVEPPALAI